MICPGLWFGSNLFAILLGSTQVCTIRYYSNTAASYLQRKTAEKGRLRFIVTMRNSGVFTLELLLLLLLL